MQKPFIMTQKSLTKLIEPKFSTIKDLHYTVSIVMGNFVMNLTTADFEFLNDVKF